MTRAGALAAVAVALAFPSAARACEAPGRPCPAVEVCETSECDGPNDPPPPPAPPRRCEEPGCDAAPKPACDRPGCVPPAVPKPPPTKRPEPPAVPRQG